jgi:hypothetical protein
MNKKDKIKQLMEKKLSYRNIAKVVGTSFQYVHQVATGYMSPYNLKRLKKDK